MAKKITKKQLVIDSKSKVALEKASSIQVDKTLNSISALGLQIQRDFGEIGLKFSEKIAELQAVELSIALKKKEMEELHGADAVLLNLDELKAQHQKTLQELSLEIQNDRETRRVEEEAEREHHNRIEEEYNYNLIKKRQLDDDTWAEQLRIRLRDETIRKEQFDKSLAIKTAELASQEAAYKSALDKVASFDVEVKREAAKEIAIQTNVLKKDHEHKNQLADMQHKSQVESLNSKFAGLEVALNQRDATITELRAQLKSAQESQIQLAKDAVNAANQKSAQADAMAMLTSIGSNGTRPARS